MDWSLIFILLKGILLILVYAVLILILVTVTRETGLRLPQISTSESSVSIGRLRILQPGSDARLSKGTILILRPETVLGTKKGSTILIRDQFVSGKHARLRWDGISWWIEDMGSTNGTFINQKRIHPNASELLPYGAILQIGDMVFEMIE